MLTTSQKVLKKILTTILSENQVPPSSLALNFSTSLSDNQAYPNVCLQASNDYRYFNYFRRDPVYNQVLEHVTEQEGQAYMNEIEKYPEIYSAMDIFRENDLWGNPIVFEYGEVGNISPTTLRYIKVLCDLQHFFHTLDNLMIGEIGIGYGGQCRIINSYFKPKTYCLVDIKPSLMLAQRFLDNYILHSTLLYKTMNELERTPVDVLISNYAFTELRRPIQDVYLEKMILPSKKGYITYNEVNPAEFKSYTKEELLAMIPHSKIITEVPLTHPKNCIIVWGVHE